MKIDEASNVIDFVHSTTQDYFDNIRDQKFPDAQGEIVTTCLTYLLFKVFSDGPYLDDDSMNERLRENVALQYAAQRWGNHPPGERQRFAQGLVLKFLETAPNLICAQQAMLIPNILRPEYNQSYPRDVQGLWVAAYFGLADVVQLLAARQADCNAVTSYGENALYIASRQGQQKVVKLLLAEKATDVDTRNGDGETELLVAAAGGHVDVVRQLCNKGANVEATNDWGCSAMYVAAEKGHSEVVHLLLEYGANFLHEDKDGVTAIDQASWCGHDAIVHQLLLAMPEKATLGYCHGPRFRWTLGNHLCKCIMRGKPGDRLAVRQLLKRGAYVKDVKDDDGMTALSRAAKKGDVEMAKLFLGSGVNVNVRDPFGEAPLHAAAKAGHAGMTRFLLECGADVEMKDATWGHTALSLAVHGHGDPQAREQVKQILLEEGANPVDASSQVNSFALRNRITAVNETVMLKAVRSQQEEDAKRDGLTMDAVCRLAEVDNNVNCRSDTTGWTALHRATADGNLPIVQYLLGHGANINARDNDGITPLHLSCINDHTSTTEKLIQAKAEMEERMERVDGTTDKSGGTPLHWACIVGSTGSIGLLLQAGAKIEARTHWCRTPLHLTARFGHVEAAKLLLSWGADLESRRDTNETSLHFAVEENQYDMVRFLIKRGADLKAQGDRGTALHVAIRTGYETEWRNY